MAVGLGMGRKCFNKPGTIGGAVPAPEVCRTGENKQPSCENTQEKPSPQVFTKERR